MSTRWATVALVAATGAAACGGLVELGPHAQVIGPDGGTLREDSSRATLVVPPGAVAQAQLISLNPVTTLPPSVHRGVSVTPAVGFAIPAELQMDFDLQDPQTGKLVAVLADGGTRLLGSRRTSSSTYVALLDGGGVFGVLSSNEACANGEDDDGDGRIDCDDPACEASASCQQCPGASGPCATGSRCCHSVAVCAPVDCDDCCVELSGGEDAGSGDGGTDGGNADAG